jgi:hypothetical protein
MMWATTEWIRSAAFGCAASMLGLAANAALAGAATPCPTTTVAGAPAPIYSGPYRSHPIVYGWLPLYQSRPTHPILQSPPTISGTATPGSILTASAGTWSSPVPLTYTYEWVRCLADCLPIRDASESTYTLTKADAVTTSAGFTTTIFVVVFAHGTDGSELNVSSCGVEVPGPRQHPPNLSRAQADALQLRGPAGQLPQLLAHNGFTVSYYVLKPGRVKFSWGLGVTGLGPKLAVGGGVFRHSGRRVSIRVRLTKLGRRTLAHRKRLVIFAHAEYTPLNRRGGQGTIVPLVLSVDTPPLHG